MEMIILSNSILIKLQWKTNKNEILGKLGGKFQKLPAKSNRQGKKNTGWYHLYVESKKINWISEYNNSKQK